jgi:glycine hydroxymethyltransferase
MHPELFSLIASEKKRQLETLELIPSENYVSPGVMKALGSELNNKYSEGYPGKRYYGGNEFVDLLENRAIAKAKQLFGADHANVQPYSGSTANMAVFFALLNLGDKFMGMELSHGGHLTHGSPVSFSGKFFSPLHYGVDTETERLDYDEIRKIALQEKPKMIISGFTAYPREIDFRKFHEIAQEVGAYSFADISHIAGLVAARQHPSPFPFTDVVMTTTHKTLRGPRGAMILCKNHLAEKIDKAVFPLLQGGPHDHAIAAKAVALEEALEPSFVKYQKQVVRNAKTLAATLMDIGFRLVSGGTDNHLILVDLTKNGVTGKEAETLLDSAGITVNKNAIPFDPRKPFDPSGIRLGTPILTTRGMKENEMKAVAGMIAEVLINRKRPEIVKQEVAELCSRFPAYAW